MEVPFTSSLDERLTYSAFFRAVNDNIMRGLNGTGPTRRQILCECGRRTCAKTLEVTVAAYRAVRDEPTRFLVTPGHEHADVQRVVAGHGSVSVVQHNGVVEAVQALRSRGERPRPLVLVIDDDPMIRELCSTCLQDAGVVVVEAPDGQRGLDQAVALLPDLVITDISMPVLDGLRLASALRRDDRTTDIPLIFLTGESAHEADARILDLGAFAYLSKPFDPDILVYVASGMLALYADAEPASAVTPLRLSPALVDDPHPSAA